MWTQKKLNPKPKQAPLQESEVQRRPFQCMWGHQELISTLTLRLSPLCYHLFHNHYNHAFRRHWSEATKVKATGVRDYYPFPLDWCGLAECPCRGWNRVRDNTWCLLQNFKVVKAVGVLGSAYWTKKEQLLISQVCNNRYRRWQPKNVGTSRSLQRGA